MTVFWYCAFYFVTYVIIEVLAILWSTPYLQATDDENVCSVCFALYLLAHQLVELVVVVGVGHSCRAGSPLFTRRAVLAPDVGAAADGDVVLAGERAVPPTIPAITTIELCRLSGRDFDGTSPIARRSDPTQDFSENSTDDWGPSIRSEDMPINLVVLNPGDREVTSPDESPHEEMQEMQEMQREIGESTLPTTTYVPVPIATTAAAAGADTASTPAPAPAPVSTAAAAAAAAAATTATAAATPDGPSPIHSRVTNAQAASLASLQGWFYLGSIYDPNPSPNTNR